MRKLGFFLAALLFFTASFVLPLQARPWLKIQNISIAGFPIVNLDVSVSNGNRMYLPLIGLDASNFKLLEDGEVIQDFSLTAVDPQEENEFIIILIDSSLSLSKKNFKDQVQSILGFLDGITNGDKVGVISFQDQSTLHCGFTSSRLEMRDCVKAVRQGGTNTVLYDAIEQGARILSELKSNRSSLLLFTDGYDEGSQITYNHILRKSQEYKVPIFTVATGQQKNLEKVAALSRQSGGEIFHANDSRSVKQIYAALPKMLDNIYRLSYRSQAVSSLSEKQVHVELQLTESKLNDKDTVSFTLPIFSRFTPWNQWLQNAWQDIHILYVLLFFLTLLLLLLTLLLFRKKNQIRLEVPSQYMHNAPQVTDSQEEVLQENYERFIARYEKDWQEQEKIEALRKRQAVQTDRETNKPIPVSLASEVYLVEKQGPLTGKKYPLYWQKVTIGQGLENSVVISDADASLRHAQIRQKESYFVLYDLISDKGTFLNGKKLLRPKVLKNFDEIQIGKTFLIFRQK